MSAPARSDRSQFTSSPTRLALEIVGNPAFAALLALSGSAQALEVAEQFLADLAVRLRPVSSHLGDAEFEALVLDVAGMKLRLATIDDRWARQAHGGVPLGDAEQGNHET